MASLYYDQANLEPHDGLHMAAAQLPNNVPERLHTGLQRMGVQLPTSAIEQLHRYVSELEKWNYAYNLTAVRNPLEMVTRHVLDSLSLLPLIKGATLLDVGAGAGLPSIPLAIARPDLRVTGLDSNGKKVRFMSHAARTLGLKNFDVIEGRVETLPAGAGFEIITSRAFGSLANFFDMTRHLLATDGVWIAMKGKLDGDERAAVPPDVEIRDTLALSVPGLDESRHAVLAVLKK